MIVEVRDFGSAILRRPVVETDAIAVLDKRSTNRPNTGDVHVYRTVCDIANTILMYLWHVLPVAFLPRITGSNCVQMQCEACDRIRYFDEAGVFVWKTKKKVEFHTTTRRLIVYTQSSPCYATIINILPVEYWRQTA